MDTKMRIIKNFESASYKRKYILLEKIKIFEHSLLFPILFPEGISKAWQSAFPLYYSYRKGVVAEMGIVFAVSNYFLMGGISYIDDRGVK